eukprot:9953359-Alexandrium_andersonii.AAC.1
MCIRDRTEGFASYRYGAGWCHAPDPDDPMAISRDANAKAAADPVLPRYPDAPLFGVFKCTHLVALLQLLKKGEARYPGTAEIACVPEGDDWEEPCPQNAFHTSL